MTDHDNVTMNASVVLVAAHAALVFRLGIVSAAPDYTVTNNGDRLITVVMIGVDAITRHFLLSAAPLGWTRDRGLPRASVRAPAGWTAMVISAEESNNVAVEWRASSHRTIAPHQTVRGVRVVLPLSTAPYTAADWQNDG